MTVLHRTDGTGNGVRATPAAADDLRQAPAVSDRSVFAAVLRHDLARVARRPMEAALPLVFFVVAASLFPLGVGPEPQVLRAIGPGVVQVAALLAAMLSIGSLYAPDRADGTLDQWLLAPVPLGLVVAAKALAHWIAHGLPLALAAPVIAAMFGLSTEALAVQVAVALLATPVLSLLGGVGAALTLGARGGALLTLLIVLPLAVPALVFGAGAVAAADQGLDVGGHLSLLGALAVFAALGAPPATAAALRIAAD